MFIWDGCVHAPTSCADPSLPLWDYATKCGGEAVDDAGGNGLFVKNAAIWSSDFVRCGVIGGPAC